MLCRQNNSVRQIELYLKRQSSGMALRRILQQTSLPARFYSTQGVSVSPNVAATSAVTTGKYCFNSDVGNIFMSYDCLGRPKLLR